MSHQTADDWQTQLDGTGEVTIATSRLRATPVLLACIAFIALGVFLLVDGTELEAVVGVACILLGLFGFARAAWAVGTGRPHLVVSTGRVRYGPESVPWSWVSSISHRTVRVRGRSAVYLAISYDASDRGMAGNDVLYVPDTIDADLTELGRWLNGVLLRHHRRE
ncbi:MAG TPA: hypothetical protein VEX15_18515 [Nocardioidaceae bacterium]|nr:hypothetical protein [Nocardioidaceae bacterium]